MDLGLRSKVALVLGGGGGLGSAIAVALAKEGARIAVADINPEALARSVSQVAEIGAQAIALEWDLADLAAIESNVAAIERQFGPVDILMSNTGGPPPTPASGQPPEAWLRNFQMMVLSVISIADRVLPAMRGRKWGRIIVGASSGIVTPIPNLAISNALRLSLVGWSKTLSREVAGDGVTVNVVVPGRIATDRIHFLDKAKADRERRPIDAVVAESTASIPLGRYGDPREYAEVVTFLASQSASYVTGSTVRIDGGLIPSI